MLSKSSIAVDDRLDESTLSRMLITCYLHVTPSPCHTGKCCGVGADGSLSRLETLLEQAILGSMHLISLMDLCSMERYGSCDLAL